MDLFRFSVDCWRFYPDAIMQLLTGEYNSGYKNHFFRKFYRKKIKIYGTTIVVFLKYNFIKNYPNRIVDKDNNSNYGKVFGSGMK